MKPGHASRTAESAAALRALHLAIDGEPPLLHDPWAARLLGRAATSGTALAQLAGTLFNTALQPRLPAWLPRRPVTGLDRIRAQVVVRSRYAEDLLQRAVAAGTTQYVILAAGLDSYALRQPVSGAPARILELDLPATQAAKRARLEALGVALPANLTLVPVDFEHQTLDAALADSAYDPRLPAFFAWLGCTYYLSASAIGATLDCIARQAPGSALVCDYWDDTVPCTLGDHALLAGLRWSVAAQGEPLRSCFTADGLQHLLGEHGLVVHEHLGADATNARYLEGRRDRLQVPGFAGLIHCGVPTAKRGRGKTRTTRGGTRSRATP